jgi:hypothetical protein
LDGEALEIVQRNMGIILKCIVSKEAVRIGLGEKCLRIVPLGGFDIRDVE